MTLIIALRCTDGIVMASDGQATAMSSGGPVRQRIQKIFKLADNVLFGASGSIGIIQRCRDIIMKHSSELIRGLSPNTRDKIRDELLRILKGELERHKAFHGSTKGAQLADMLICTCEFGSESVPIFRIWHICSDCSDELLDELGYGCSGIGDTFAYTLLSNYYSENIDIERGKVIAYRVIKDAINVGAYGLGEPIDIWVMKVERDCSRVNQLSDSEIMALNDAYMTWKEMERSVLKGLFNKSDRSDS